MRLTGSTPNRSQRFETASALLDCLRSIEDKVWLRKLSKVEKSEMWSGGPQASLHWLIRDNFSIFLVILESTDSLHTVAVDTSLAQRIIVDSLEPYAIAISIRALELSGCGPSTQVLAVRRVVLDE